MFIYGILEGHNSDHKFDNTPSSLSITLAEIHAIFTLRNVKNIEKQHDFLYF